MYVVNIVNYIYCTLLVQMNGYTKSFIYIVEGLRSGRVYASQRLVELEPRADRCMASFGVRCASRTVSNLAVLLRAGPPYRLDKDLAHVDIDILQLDLKHITVP